MQYKYFPHEGRGGLPYSFSAAFLCLSRDISDRWEVKRGAFLYPHKYLLSIDPLCGSETVPRTRRYFKKKQMVLKG